MNAVANASLGSASSSKELPGSVVLLAASPPGELGVGQNYIRDVSAQLPVEELHCCALLRDTSDWPKSARSTVSKTLILDRRYESAWRHGPKSLSGVAANLAFRARSTRWANQQAQQVKAFCDQNHCDDVWAVLESPQTILMAENLVESGLRIHSLVWDHPRHVISSFGHQGYSLDRLLAAFDATISNSDSIMAVADSLLNLLKTKNPNASAGVVRSPVLEEPTAGYTNDLSQPFVIGFAGSVTAPDEFADFQKALDGVNWQIAGRDIVLRLFGFRYTLTSKSARRVEYRGFLETTQDVANALSQCHACYLPQPFSDQRRLVAEYSFPTKLSTYLAAGCPIIVHAPEYASVAKFAGGGQNSGEASVGVISCGKEGSSVLPALEKLISDAEFYRVARDRTAKVRQESFSAIECKQTLQRLFCKA